MNETTKTTPEQARDNVINLMDRIGKKYGGDPEFMLCSCQPEGAAMLPVVRHDAVGPFIVALVCPTCENEIPICNGRPDVSAV